MTHLGDEESRCLVDVDVLLGRGLVPAREAVLLAVLVHARGLVHHALFLLVALQRQSTSVIISQPRTQWQQNKSFGLFVRFYLAAYGEMKHQVQNQITIKFNLMFW